MPFQVSPGVNVSEIDLTTVVPAVSTTEGALAGHFKWGPVDQRVLIDSEDRLVNIYNKPNANTATDFFTAANFLAYGNALYVNRVVNTTVTETETTKTGSISDVDGTAVTGSGTAFTTEYAVGDVITFTVANADLPGNEDVTVTSTIASITDNTNLVLTNSSGLSSVTTSNTPAHKLVKYSGSANNATSGGVGSFVKNEEDYQTYTAKSSHGYWMAKYPGEMGNSLKVSVCSTANAWSSNVTTAAVGGTYDIARNSSFMTTSIDLSSKLVVGDIVLMGPDKIALNVKEVNAAAGGNSANVIFKQEYTGAAVSTGLVKDLTRRWEYFNNFDNAPGTTAYAEAVGGTGDAIHVAVVDEDGAITGSQGTVIDVYDGVSLAIDAKGEQGAGNYYKEVINQNSPYIWFADHQIASGGKRADLGTTFVTSTAYDLPSNWSFTGGTDGDQPTSAQKVTGYDIFKSAEDVDVSFLLGSDADQTLATYLITNIAESRKDCIAVLSPERADCVNNNAYVGAARDDVIAFRDTLPSSSYAVIDSGWKYQYDKYNDLYRYVPLNGDTAGLMVQTDNTRDPWYSPAGFNRGNVKNCIRLAWNPSKGDRDQLYKKGINPVVTFPGQGTVLFGDKTMLAKPSAFDRINVRRLFIVLEKAISTASKFTLFEFNDEFTRSQFRNLVEPFLRDVQGRRGITDFRVVCDGTNNTGEVIDRNEFIGDIYIKPARSINFIQLNFVAVRTGVEFSEVVGQFG